MATEKDVSANVDWVLKEATRQLDQQVSTAGVIDSRASTLLGVIGGVTGITGVFSDINLDAPLRIVTTVVAAGLAALSAGFLAASLWPRTGASYGTELAGATDLADKMVSLEFRRNMARSLTQARAKNTKYLKGRQDNLRLGIALFAAAVISVIAMIATGAFVPVPATP